jgi:hypothetical protein
VAKWVRIRLDKGFNSFQCNITKRIHELQIFDSSLSLSLSSSKHYLVREKVNILQRVEESGYTTLSSFKISIHL